MNLLPWSRVQRWLVAAALWSGVATLQAGEIRTWTDKLGRSVRAEVIALKGDQLKIKREDGQVFTISLKSLSEEDQKAASKSAEGDVKPESKITFECSRPVFETKKQEIDLKTSTGAVLKAAATQTQEKSGYDIVVRNQTANPVKQLVIEYVLFAKSPRETGDKTTPDPLRRQFAACHTSLEAMKSLTYRASIATWTKIKLKPGVVWDGAHLDQSRSTLHGIWLRIYADEILVAEYANPAGLSSTEPWRVE